MKYALVTGASRGIGRAIATRLAREGYNIIINYRSNDAEAEAALKEVHQAGSDGCLMRCDVCDREALTQQIKEWQAAHPGEYIEVLVNNAGIRRDNLMMWMTHEEWRSVLDINLEGFFAATQAVLKDMLVNKNGRIINIVSLSGLKGMPGQTNYSAAKGAIIAATKALSQEVAKKRVTVNAIAPGFIATDLTSDLDEGELKKLIPAARFGKPEEVAALAAFLASPEAAYITGEVISINGGLYT